MISRALERLVGAVIVPSVRPPGGLAPGSLERRPSRAYLQRFPPAGLIGFGRRYSDGATIGGLAEQLAVVRRDAVEPLFACSDLEQGAGYHLPKATLLPPARALVEAQNVRPGTLFDAGQITGTEARAAGIELVLAPVLDVNSNPSNPIISARAFGCESAVVAAAANQFLEGLHSSGVGASLKHFPGHGDTAVDSHLGLPRIERSLCELEALELLPFREVLRSSVARAMGPRLTIMAGHLDVPALTGVAGLPASLSRHAMSWLSGQNFDGVVLTDGLEMLAVAREPELGVRALEAGCHGLLAPGDEGQLALELLDAIRTGRLDKGTLAEAARRMSVLRRALLGAERAPALKPQPKIGLEIALLALQAQPGWEKMRAELELGRQEGIEILGAAELVERFGGTAASSAVRVALGVEGRPLPESSLLKRATSFIWFGAPESLPVEALGCPHLWAWSLGGAPEAVVRHLISAVKKQRELPGSPP